MLQNAPSKHSAILLTFIKLPFVLKNFVWSIFEWSFKTGFTVHLNFFQVKVFGTCIHEEKERNKQLEDNLHSKLVENNKLSEMMAHMRQQVCKISQTCYCRLVVLKYSLLVGTFVIC